MKKFIYMIILIIFYNETAITSQNSELLTHIEDEVCFYKDENYSGEFFCLERNNAISKLNNEHNNSISSIKIPLGLAVNIYQDSFYKGESMIIYSNIDMNELKKLGFHDSISSFYITSAACFYTEDKFTGSQYCLAADHSEDFYTRTINKFQNDSISSIYIPRNMLVSIYKNDNFNPPYYFIHESMNANGLRKIDMLDNISSIRTFNEKFVFCIDECVINKEINYNLPLILGNYWHDNKLPHKYISLNFKRTQNDNYEVVLLENNYIFINYASIIFRRKNQQEGLTFYLNENSNQITLLIRINDPSFEVQYVESYGTQYINSSPIIVSNSIDLNNIEPNIIIYNKEVEWPLILNSAVFAVNQGLSVSKRNTHDIMICITNPLLGLYNYVVQGRCNQPELFVTKLEKLFSSNIEGHPEKILQVAGSAKPLTPLDNNHPASVHPLLMRLTHINTDTHGHTLSLAGATYACKTPVTGRTHRVTRRQIKPNQEPHCILWTMDILTDYTLLFGSSIITWNRNHFGQVINNIIAHGTTGFAVRDPNIEARLVASVLEHLHPINPNEIGSLKTAFDYAQLTYVGYQELNALDAEQEELFTLAREPIQAQSLPMGRYELQLDGYTYREVIPRIREYQQWVEHPELHFDVEVINGTPEETSAARQRILQTAEQWRETYFRQGIPRVPSGQPSTQDGTFMQTGRTVSDIIRSWLRTPNEDYIYVVVRLRGEIVSLAVATDIGNDNVGLAASITAPAYVINPIAENAVRGSGTAAVHALAKYLKEKKKKSLISIVISQPSAIVKNKLGFKFIEDM